MDASEKRCRWFRRAGITAAVLLLLEFFPGAYTIEDFQDEWDLESPEAAVLMAVEELRLDTVMEFDRPTRQRISRNAELLVPADTTLTLQASMVPLIEEEEAVAKPRTWELRSSRPLIFVYRGVTVARAKRMSIRADDEKREVRAIGMYRVLSALATAHRYHRQREVRRDYQAPDRALLNSSLRFRTSQTIPLENVELKTGSSPGHLRMTGFQWEDGSWTGGSLALDIRIADLEGTLAALAANALSEATDFGILALKFDRLHTLTILTNRLRVFLNGSITSANSSTVEHMFDPSFQAELEVGFRFPSGQTLESAELEVYLAQIHSFDINRSNTLLDKAVRNLLRNQRDKASADISLAEELPDHPAIPRNFLFEEFGFTGLENGEVVLSIRGSIPPPQDTAAVP